MIYLAGFALWALCLVAVLPLMTLRIFGIYRLSYWIIFAPVYIPIIVVSIFVMPFIGLMLILSGI